MEDKNQNHLSSISSAFPAIPLGFISLGEILMCVTVFNPTIEVVTFRHRGSCVLGVFLLPAFTRLGNECQNLLSPCDRMHVCRDWTSVYSLIRKSSFLRNVVGTYVNSKGKITSTGGWVCFCCRHSPVSEMDVRIF